LLLSALGFGSSPRFTSVIWSSWWVHIHTKHI
jgi:hypothetical protein